LSTVSPPEPQDQRFTGRPGIAGRWARGFASCGRFLLLVISSQLTGCTAWKGLSDQSRFAPLDHLRTSGQAVVRLYAAPIPSIGWLAVHTWFVVKPARSDTFERWELWQTGGLRPGLSEGACYGHVYRNLLQLESNCGAGKSYLLAELVGPSAEPVVEFIRGQSPGYPRRLRYAYYPGPNSNTYVQWVLDHTAWRVPLPPAAIGKDWRE
jgi:hypothetical protein